MDHLILFVLGLFLSVLGIINMTGNIQSVHSYNRRKVKQQDTLHYGRAIGLGTLIIGVSSVISFFLLYFYTGFNIGYVMKPSIVIGLIIILYGQFKYNRGIF